MIDVVGDRLDCVAWLAPPSPCSAASSTADKFRRVHESTGLPGGPRRRYMAIAASPGYPGVHRDPVPVHGLEGGTPVDPGVCHSHELVSDVLGFL
jgi:hypothetical protein